MQHIRSDHPRSRRPAAALALALAALLAAPALTHPGLAPPHGPDRPSLAAVFDAPDQSPNAALIAAVMPHAVRLPVDKAARHPLDSRLAVRPGEPLGSKASALRLVRLPAPGIDAVAALETPPVKTPSPAPDTPAAKSVAILAATSATAPGGKALPPATPQPAAPLRTATPAAQTTPAQPVPSAKAAAPAAPPAPAQLATAPGKRILVAGDSLSLFLADALRPMLAGRPQTAFASRGKVSSGLARPDFFNWEREMAALTTAHAPDTVIVMIATNDNQTLARPDGTKLAFGRPGWDAEYGRRVRRLVEIARSANPSARIYWLGAPVMADPKLNADVAAINAVIARELAALPGCRYIDVSRTLADPAGRYAQAKITPDGPKATRTKDGVHLTPFGAKLLANAALASLGPNLAALSKP
ncbi:DUF459 domain-containing protein [Solidesulfovibrio magneticus]|nr:DUF459 domain-containing protein [Solidesulfovibrio magneticus]